PAQNLPSAVSPPPTPAVLHEPTIRFQCPTCGATVTAPTRKVGKKSSCPRCGQRLQVPPQPNTTVLGRPLPNNAAPLQASEPPLCVIPVLSPVDEEPEEVRANTPRRSRRVRIALVLTGCLLFSSLMIALALSLGGSERGSGSSGSGSNARCPICNY